MTTHRTRDRVSLATRSLALAAIVTTGACATGPARLAQGGGLSPLSRPALVVDGAEAPAEAPVATIRFDNQAHDYVRVYLVDDRKQEWLLGRVERGASTSLKLPKSVLDGSARWVRLSVLPDDRSGARSAGESRLVTMGVEPVDVVLSQRWTFTQSLAGGQLTALPLERLKH